MFKPSICLYTLVCTSSISLAAALQKAELIEIQKINPDIVVDLIWASGKNELELILYPDDAKCYMHKNAAYALNKAQKKLAIYGYGLKVLEGYRPLSAQKVIWNHIGFKPPYPEYGRHTLGTAVDVTLINLVDGNIVALPAYQSREINPEFIGLLTPDQNRNLEILQQVMEKNGFIRHKKEWFHFDFQGWETFMALDYQFSELT